MSVPRGVERQAEREIDQLQRELEDETDPVERAKIQKAIRDVERELGEWEREDERRQGWNEDHGGGGW